MKTTFILAQHFGITPFEIMRQDIDAVIMVINYLVSGSNAVDSNDNTNDDEKKRDQSFWACL